MMFNWFKKTKPVEVKPAEKRASISAMALDAATRKESKILTFGPYIPPAGVIPESRRSEVLAMDATPYDYVNQAYVNNYFPGYQYLAMLAQLPEYRKFAEVPAKDMTRKWIKLSSRNSGDDKKDKIAAINAALIKHKVQAKFRRAAELDSLYGRAQIYIDVEKPGGGLASQDTNELASILFVAPSKIKKGSLRGFNVVEPVWTYPSAYNANNPLDPYFYKPQSWFVMGQETHGSRLLNFVSREVPDLLKAAYNFGGLSMSQMAQPYVMNWYRTRDSISDMVHSFSLSGIMTRLDATLTGADDAFGTARAQMFNSMRDNRGLLMLDKETEEFFQFNTPLSGLDALQAQAQEQMGSVANMPLVVLLGITPSGLNASAEGEIAIYDDSIHSRQEMIFRDNLVKVINIIQLDEFGEIDEDITFDFEPLREMTEIEKSTVRKTDADRDAVLVSVGAVSPDEVRARIAADPDSGFDALESELDDGDDSDLSGRSNMLKVKAKVDDE